MNRFVPMDTAPFQPNAPYAPRPIYVNVRPFEHVVDYGAASTKGKGKGRKKKSWWDKVKEAATTVAPVVTNVAADVLYDKTGVDITGQAAGSSASSSSEDEAPVVETKPNWGLIIAGSVATVALGTLAVRAFRNS